LSIWFSNLEQLSFTFSPTYQNLLPNDKGLRRLRKQYCNQLQELKGKKYIILRQENCFLHQSNFKNSYFVNKLITLFSSIC
jgi:hypothetical protein